MTRACAVVGGALLAAGLAWSYSVRGRGALLPLVVLVLGAALVVASAVAHVRAQRDWDRLVRPEGPAAPLPAPAWWAPVLAAGAGLLAGGPLAGGAAGTWVGVAGAVLALSAVVGLGGDLQRPPAALDRGTVRTARALRAFAGRHGQDGSVEIDGVLQPVGRGTTRVVVVAADGAVGDAVLESERAALAARLAGVRLHETFRQLGGRG